jgi:hypothetical protein
VTSYFFFTPLDLLLTRGIEKNGPASSRIPVGPT